MSTWLAPWAESVVVDDLRPADKPLGSGYAYDADPCAVETCGKSLIGDEVAYKVTELGEPYVCWRHIEHRAGLGPVSV